MRQLFWDSFHPKPLCHISTKTSLRFPKKMYLPAKTSENYLCFLLKYKDYDLCIVSAFSGVLSLKWKIGKVMTADMVLFDSLYCSSYANYWNILLLCFSLCSL